MLTGLLLLQVLSDRLCSRLLWWALQVLHRLLLLQALGRRALHVSRLLWQALQVLHRLLLRALQSRWALQVVSWGLWQALRVLHLLLLLCRLLLRPLRNLSSRVLCEALRLLHYGLLPLHVLHRLLLLRARRLRRAVEVLQLLLVL